MLAYPHPANAAARRADHRRRSGLAARILADPLFAARGRRDDPDLDLLSRRGRALQPPRTAAQWSPHALQYAARAEETFARRPHRNIVTGRTRGARRAGR